MTTLINQTSEKTFILITDGYTVEVFAGNCYLNVYAGKARMGNGRTFHQETIQDRLLAAIESYRAPEIKAGLRALLCELT